MEGSGAQSQSSDRSRQPPPPFPRTTSSLSSTSSTRTRVSNNSSNSSSHHIPTLHSHRLHHSRCSRTPTIDRPKSQLSREASEDSRQSLPPIMSSFLQERLERERRVESERSSSRASNVSSSLDFKAVQSSPSKSSIAESRRPRSSGGSEPVKNKGFGLKEMEQTLSTLHKQNFDLKLELFHRRERQTALEDRLEKLESDKEQTDQINDQLLHELEKRDKAIEEAVEKRDKAIEEAVAMIVVLEARVEQLLREREMVRQIDEAGIFYTQPESPAPAKAPKTKMLEPPVISDAKALNRMPSFLSERSENTENLRNIYLGARGSVLSLSRTAEDNHEAERIIRPRLNSPTLSVLSESSFLSVYGQKHPGGNISPPEENPSALDGPPKNHEPPPKLDSPKSDAFAETPTRLRQSSASPLVSSTSGQFQTMNNFLDASGSPLQQLERLDTTLTTRRKSSKPSISSLDKIRPPSRSSSMQPKTKQEKRQALERVLTQGQLGRESAHLNGLPPTPDTISTTTLRHYQSSNDTLSREQSLVNERSYLALSEATTSQDSELDGYGAGRGLSQKASQAASITAFGSRKQLPGNGTLLDCQFVKSQPRRPRSASDTTMSQYRGKDDWDSDSSDEELADGGHSAASSFDPWLRESQKPDRSDALDPLSSVSQAGPGKKNMGRVSPDLFSFPMTTTGWATEVMFGALGGAGYRGAGGANMSPSPMADTLDALGQSLSTPLFGSGLVPQSKSSGHTPPPPPDRRSSLHARTGSISVMPISPLRPSTMSSKLKRTPARGTRKRSNSIDARPPPDSLRDFGLRQSRAVTVPPEQLYIPPQQPQEVQQQQQQPQSAKQRHYPPTASQLPRSRGLNNIFRRSTGSTDAPQLAASPHSAPPTETTFEKGSAQLVGMPSWGLRAVAAEDDFRDSATPPPILRSKAGRSGFDDSGGARLEPFSSGGGGGGALVGHDVPGTSWSNNSNGGAGLQEGPPPSAGSSSIATTTSSSKNEGGSSGGGKRRWLGLGRSNSHRKSGGAAV
ncbi:hypothetical protein B0T17DRAFT_7330 [Bombardia bombarda]|uniref:Centrosomin N-terminal motif 1 domain-containing protein n=1 Tax=Bombardia bombarda TaxID=252184 RepID=A0AA39XID2_9PEZI|nr:hypothetical protein B0T17DRAFT_7330 [Bombardia bombarda]